MIDPEGRRPQPSNARRRRVRITKDEACDGRCCLLADLSVTEVCFAFGYASLGTVSTRLTGPVGMPASGTYRRHVARATAEMPSCVAGR